MHSRRHVHRRPRHAANAQPALGLGGTTGDEETLVAGNTEAVEKAEHPLQRIIAIEDRGEEIEVTTTRKAISSA